MACYCLESVIHPPAEIGNGGLYALYFIDVAAFLFDPSFRGDNVGPFLLIDDFSNNFFSN